MSIGGATSAGGIASTGGALSTGGTGGTSASSGTATSGGASAFAGSSSTGGATDSAAASSTTAAGASTAGDVGDSQAPGSCSCRAGRQPSNFAPFASFGLLGLILVNFLRRRQRTPSVNRSHVPPPDMLEFCGRRQARSSTAATRASPGNSKSHDPTDDECNPDRDREITPHLRTEQD